MDEDLFANVRPASHKIVADYHGTEYLLQLVTHEIRPGPDQKMLVICDGATTYESIQDLLKTLQEFLDDPVQKRFFVPVPHRLDLHIYIIEEVRDSLTMGEGNG